MKTLKHICMTLCGIVLCTIFSACSDEEDSNRVVKTIHVETAGTLPSLISAEEITQTTDLTLSGYINGTDVKVIRKMSSLKRADFTNLHIVGGGDYYDSVDLDIEYRTQDNIFPIWFFHGFYWLDEIKLPNSVTEIGNSAFFGCTGLTSVEIPNGVTKIGELSFNMCENLTSIKIPNSITEIGNNAFKDCTGLTSVEVPNSVTKIGYNAFQNCTDLTTVKLSNNVTELDYTFEGCTSLISVEIPDSVTTLNSTFSGCSSLASIEIPNSVTTLDGTFSGCTSLASIEIPNSVTEIGSWTFADAGLKELHIKNSTPPNVAENAFSTYAYVTLYVPIGSKDAYMQHEIWGKFGNIVEE